MVGKKALFEFFKISPTPSLLLFIDAPIFTIADVNEAFLEATHSKREDLVGKGIFEVFPANDSDNATDGDSNLTLSSLNTVLKTHKKHQMAIQKYDIPIGGTSEFELKYWESENIPLFDDDGKLNLIAHCSRDVTKQIKTEKQFKEFEYFFKNSNDFSCIANTDGYIEIANSSFNKVLGYSQNELTVKPFIDFVHPEDIADTLQAYNKIKSGASLIHFINRYRKKDGSYLWLDWNATPNPISGKLYCIARDVTERKKAEDETSTANEMFSSIFNFSPVAISISDALDGRFIQVNDAFCQMTGYKRENLIGKKSVDMKIIEPDKREKLITHVANQGSERRDVEGAIRNTNGEIVYILYRVEKIEIDSKPYFVSALIDISSRKKTEEDLKLLNEELEQRVKERTQEVEKALHRFEYVTKATSDAIWDWDFENNRVYRAEGFKTIFGFDMDELNVPDTNWENYIHPDDRDSVTKSIYEKINSSGNYWKKDFRIIKPNGKVAFVQDSAYIIRSENNNVTRIIGAIQDITKKKQEELRLKLLESVITNTDDSILITEAEPFDEPGPRIIYVNEAFTKMTGYSSEEVIGKTPRILQGPKTDAAELKKLSTALRNWQPCEATLLNYKKNGEEFWIHLAINPVADDTGWFTHWISIERDVTKQKQEEERLKLLESVITNTNDAVVIKEALPSDEFGRKIVYVNESFTRMSGYSPDEIIGKTNQLLHGPNTNPEELKRFYKSLDKWQACEITIINYTKQGKEYWVSQSLNPIINEKGEYTHWISIERDVTERKKQEKELFVTTLRLFDTLESIQDGFYTLDTNWNVTYWNQLAEKLSGRKQEDMIGKNFWKIYEGRISEKIITAFYKAKANNKPIRIEVYSKQAKNWLEINAFPSDMGLTVYFKNITERKHTESKLKKIHKTLESHIKELAVSNLELEQFAYVASHDLQEPLRMVTSFLTQIEKKYENVLDEKGKKYIFFAVDGAKRMRQIILDLLEFSRVGKKEIKYEEVDLNTIIEEITLLYKKQIEEKKAQIQCEVLPIIKTHAAPIKQVFQNLISNALKYSKPNEKPVITISCQKKPTSWEFEIKDNGIGISQEYFDKIFIIFQRLHSKEEYSGTGMGLAITKKIIENLKGQIWVKSEEGKGTSFYFTIPKK